MSTAVRSVAWRLSVEGDQLAVQKLESVGRAGGKAIQPVPGYLKAVNAASEEAQGAFSGLVGEAGALGEILGASGPIGAGIVGTGVVLSIAANEAFKYTEQAQKFADQIETTAQRVHLGVEAYQELVQSGREYNLTQDQIVSGLSDLRNNVSQFIAGVGGRGGMSRVFQDLGLSREQLASAGTFQQQLNLIADALNRVQNTQVRDGLAQKLGVGDLVPMLQGGSAALNKMMSDTKSAGLVMEQTLVKQGAEANKQYEILEQKVAINLHNAFLGLSPILLNLKSQTADLIGAVSNLVQSFLPIERRTESALQSRYNDLSAQIERIKPMVDAANSRGQNDSAAQRARQQLNNATKERDAVLKELSNRFGSQIGPYTLTSPSKVKLPPSQEDIANANKRQRELDALDNKEQSLAQARQQAVDRALVDAQKSAADRVNAENAADVEILRGKEGYYQALLKQANDERDAEIKTIDAREKAQLDSLDKQQQALDKLKADYAKLGKGLPNYDADKAQIDTARQNVTQGAQDEREAVSMRNQAQQVQIYREARGSLGELADTLSGPLKTALQDISTNELNRFTDDLTDVMTDAKSAGDAIKDMVDSMIADLARLVLQRSATAPLAGALGGVLDSWFGGGHATGGNVNAGMVYRVNENGGMPETFFTPGGQGTILSGPSSLDNVVNLVSRRVQPPAVAVQTAPPKVEIHNHGEPVDVASQSYDPSSNTTKIDLKGQLEKATRDSVRGGGLDASLRDRFGVQPVPRRRR